MSGRGGYIYVTQLSSGLVKNEGLLESIFLTLINYSCTKSPIGCSDFDHMYAV